MASIVCCCSNSKLLYFGVRFSESLKAVDRLLETSEAVFESLGWLIS